jgi:hypothetical protein
VLLKRGKNDGIAVYVPKETILKETVAKIDKFSQHLFFGLVREFSDSSEASLASRTLRFRFDIQHQFITRPLFN